MVLGNRKPCVDISSFNSKEKTNGLPDSYFVLILGSPYPLKSGRVAVKTEPYPGRWTTHIIISKMSDLDEELFAWAGQAYMFSEKK